MASRILVGMMTAIYAALGLILTQQAYHASQTDMPVILSSFLAFCAVAAYLLAMFHGAALAIWEKAQDVQPEQGC